MAFLNEKLENRLNKPDFEISNSGLATLGKEWHYSLGIAPYSRIYFVIDGNDGWLKDASSKIDMKPGHCYFIPCEHNYAYGCDGTFKKVYFHMNIKREEGFDVFDHFGRIGELYMPEQVSLLAECFTKKDTYSILTVKTILLSAITMISKKYDYSLDSDQEYSDLMHTALRYIRKNLSAKLTCKEIASSCHVSESTVSKHFTHELGMTVGKYIDTLVLLEAKKRLLYTNDKIGKISADLGYADQFYFSNRFTKAFMMSPSQFKKRYAQLS